MFERLLAWLALNRAAVKVQSSTDDVKAAIDDMNHERARWVAKRYTRGDVQIQNGDYITAEDIDSVLGHAPWRS